MSTFINPYYVLPSSLLLIPAVYFLLVQPKKNAKPSAASSTEPPSRGWRDFYAKFQIFLPLLVPKDPVIKKRLIFNHSIVGVCILVARVVRAAKPILMRQIVDTLSSSNPTPCLPWVEVALYALCRNIISHISLSVSNSYRKQAKIDISDLVTSTLYDKLLDQSADYLENKQTGSLYKAVRMSGDHTVEYFQYLVVYQVPTILDVFLALATCWATFDTNMAAGMVVSMTLYAVVFILALKWGKSPNKRMAKLGKNVDHIGYDTILNWQTVAYFNRAAHERSRFASALKKKAAPTAEDIQLLNYPYTVRAFVEAIMAATVSLLACYQIQHSDKSAGDFAMLFEICSDIFSTLDRLLDIFPRADRFLSRSTISSEILKLQPTVQDKPGAPDFTFRDGTIEFNHVTFSYDGERNIVNNVSFTAPGGKTVAIIGESGGGKSTLLKLLCRLYDPTAGSIRIDGQDLRNVRLGSLRDHVSIVPQSVGVFNVTVLENLRYANLTATKEQIEDACRAAALHTHIMSLPKGYDEPVGEKGIKLSGGELQRLAIARALLREAPIVLFDEATSNLDAETEGRVQDYLKKWYSGRTVIIVAHRLATVADADLIISFRDGQMVESGRLDELLARRGYFWNLWNKQRLDWEPPAEEKIYGDDF
ncbi:P-loop containing nucleoside triphosphate hydrolase protein [Bombardia bombarda]|uniref:P-loop containing nucleoside triphosphate hydrolase protein n=1 Tax=Bombardia bombarda TaxID=252184 RepID=A0AA39TWT2_9PEZI|nr:P-loop containing nucleoside triphosphate hydrolase protein [Bombardia bombarda]